MILRTLFLIIMGAVTAWAANTQNHVWIVNKTLKPGEIIASSDLKLAAVSGDVTRRYTPMEADDLIGMQVKRTLRAGNTVRENAVKPAEVIKKKSFVMLSLQTEFMNLSAQGQAMDDGAMGDVIRVMNLNSKHVVHAVVTGPRQAQVFINTAGLNQMTGGR